MVVLSIPVLRDLPEIQKILLIYVIDDADFK
jgi:hypothetical protein